MTQSEQPAGVSYRQRGRSVLLVVAFVFSILVLVTLFDRTYRDPVIGIWSASMIVLFLEQLWPEEDAAE